MGIYGEISWNCLVKNKDIIHQIYMTAFLGRPRVVLSLFNMWALKGEGLVWDQKIRGQSFTQNCIIICVWKYIRVIFKKIISIKFVKDILMPSLLRYKVKWAALRLAEVLNIKTAECSSQSQISFIQSVYFNFLIYRKKGERFTLNRIMYKSDDFLYASWKLWKCELTLYTFTYTCVYKSFFRLSCAGWVFNEHFPERQGMNFMITII